MQLDLFTQEPTDMSWWQLFGLWFANGGDDPNSTNFLRELDFTDFLCDLNSQKESVNQNNLQDFLRSMTFYNYVFFIIKHLPDIA